MAYIELDLTVLLFEDEVTVWHNYSEDSDDPETVTSLISLFEGYVEDLKGGFDYNEAKRYVEVTLTTLEQCKALLLTTLEEMKQRETR